MSDLVEFLTARLDEDRQTAFASERFIEAVDDEPSEKGKEWAPSDGAVITAERGEVVAEVTIWKPEPIAVHIARWDPARALAEVEAKRRIIALHGPDTEICEPGYVEGITHHEVLMAALHNGVPDQRGHCDTLKALALPYADHPDYLPEWRP